MTRHVRRVRIQAGPRRVRCLAPTAAELWRGVEPAGRHVVALDLTHGAVLLVERGRARLRGAGPRAVLEPGHACVAPPTEAVVLEILEDAPLEHRWLRLPEAPPTPATLLVHDGALHRALTELDDGVSALDAAVREVRRVARAAEGEPPRAAAVRRAVRLILSNLAHAASPEELARAAGVGKYHLAHRFKDEVGISPHAYRICARVCRAQQLLRSGEPLAGVAAQCGFTDQSHLHHWFARVLGVTPGRYASAWRRAALTRGSPDAREAPPPGSPPR